VWSEKGTHTKGIPQQGLRKKGKNGTVLLVEEMMRQGEISG